MARRRPLLRRARDEAQIVYGPQIRGLSELALRARRDYRRGVRAAEGSTAGIRQAVREARPTVRRAYGEAAERAETAGGDVQAALSGLGESADPYRALVAREEGQAATQVGEARAGALSDLAQRGVDAQAGLAYQRDNLRSQFKQERGGIDRQKSALEREIGLFTRSTLGELRSARAELDLENARLQLEARQVDADLTGRDPATGRRTADERDRVRDDRLARRKERRERREGRGGGGPSRGAVSHHQGMVEEMQEVRQIISRQRDMGEPFDAIYTLLTDPTSFKNDDGDAVENPEGGHDQIVARAMIQVARDGRVSRENLRALRERGLLLKRTPKRWKRGKREEQSRLPTTGSPGNPFGLNSPLIG